MSVQLVTCTAFQQLARNNSAVRSRQSLLPNNVKVTSRCSRGNITRGAGWLPPRSIMHRTNFTLCNITEQCMESQQPLSINFKKAFDSVYRQSLWNIARLYRIPEHYVDICRNLYLNPSCCVKTDTGLGEFFNIKSTKCPPRMYTVIFTVPSSSCGRPYMARAMA